MSNGEFEIADLLPRFSQEFVTANDGRDKIDQIRLRTIEAVKKNTQAGITEYTAYVLYVTDNTPDVFFLDDIYGKAKQIFGGKAAPVNPQGPIGKAIAYIVGPKPSNTKERLPHDHLIPPCNLPAKDIPVDTLDPETKRTFNKIWYPCSFMLPRGLEGIEPGTTVSVSFSKGPAYGSFRGGIVRGILSGKKDFETSKLFETRCKGFSQKGPAGAFVSGPTLTSGASILQDAGYKVSIAGGYPGPCRFCQAGCDVEISLDVSRISNFVPKKASGNDPRALFAMLVDPFLPAGTVLSSGLRSPQSQQNILIREVNRMKDLPDFTTSERAQLAQAVKKAEEATKKGTTPTRELFNVYNTVRKKYKGKVKVLLIGPPRVGSGHQNPGDFSLSFAVDYSGVRLDCILEALNLAGPIIAPYTPISRAIREGANNAVHVDFMVTDAGRGLSKLAAENPDAAAEKIKAILQQADEKLQEIEEAQEEIPETSEAAEEPGLVTNVSEQVTNTSKSGA